MSTQQIQKDIPKDVFAFFLAMGVGISLDWLVFQLNGLINPAQYAPTPRGMIAFIGVIQILFILIAVYVLRHFNYSGMLTILGLLIPQTLVIKQLYRRPYVSQAIRVAG